MEEGTTKFLGLGLAIGLFIGLVLGLGLSISSENQANLIRTEYIERNISAEVEGKHDLLLTTVNLEIEGLRIKYPECSDAFDRIVGVLE